MYREGEGRPSVMYQEGEGGDEACCSSMIRAQFFGDSVLLSCELHQIFSIPPQPPALRWP